jgi:hypothetical protein
MNKGVIDHIAIARTIKINVEEKSVLLIPDKYSLHIHNLC